MNTYFTTELVRGWKVCALLAGVALLLVGMVAMPAPDWTISTVVWMSAATAVLAPWAVDVLWRMDWKWMPVAALAAWVAVDGVWMLSIDGSEAAWSMREGQWPASLCMFIAYGMALRHKGPLRGLFTYEGIR